MFYGLTEILRGYGFFLGELPFVVLQRQFVDFGPTGFTLQANPGQTLAVRSRGKNRRPGCDIFLVLAG